MVRRLVLEAIGKFAKISFSKSLNKLILANFPTISLIVLFQSYPLTGDEMPEQLAACKKLVEKNVEVAKGYLTEISHQPGVIELKPNLLYLKKIRDGNERSKVLYEVGSPTLRYKEFQVVPEGEALVWSVEEPKKINLRYCIPGFREGVKGMIPGEVRKIYMHPDLAFGKHGQFAPSLNIVFEVELIAIE